MPLSDLTKPTEIWSNVVSKKTGKEYPNIQNCNDIETLERDEPELAEFLTKSFETWYKKSGKEAAEKELKDWKDGGFKIKHDDGWQYKFTRGQDKKLQLSRIKPFPGGGFKKGGGFTHFRTTEIKFARAEEVATIINNQAPTDNWEVKFIKSDARGDMFQMENKKSYSPTVETTKEIKKKLSDVAEGDGDEDQQDISGEAE